MGNQQVAQTLLDPVQLGQYTLKNRIVMAPMTRGRCDPQTNIPNDLLIKYYTQRSQFGLIITECAAVSQIGNGYFGSGAIYNDNQIEGWKRVTGSVHEKDGKIFQQIVHCGRAATKETLGGQTPLAPSPVSAGRQHGSNTEYPVPREMTKDDIKKAVEEFRSGAERAQKAGFDGVEIHGANGYLIDSFIRTSSNQRTDDYGGSIPNRGRFALEVVDAITSVWGSDKVGIKLSPCSTYNAMRDDTPFETFKYLLEKLNNKNLAYVHISQGSQGEPKQMENLLEDFRKVYTGTLIGNQGFQVDTANQALQKGTADLISFGKLAITNPDLPSRIQNQLTLNESVNFATMFYGGEQGYTDFPNFEDQPQALKGKQ